MKKLLSIAAATAICLSSGAASAASSASISDTGYKSKNKIEVKEVYKQYVDNNNCVDVSNSNGQGASSGSANVSGNLKGGDATSGDASNTNSSSTSVNISNNVKGLSSNPKDFNASISDTGKKSYNKISYTSYNKQVVNNNNNVKVSNSNSQSASSGSANVSGNLKGGDATSGNASNHNSATTNVHISNSVN